MEKVETALEQLENVVDETARAIREGNLAVMAALAERTEAALADLESQEDPQRLAALLDQAARNSKGLEAAARGVRAARRRLADVAAVHAGGQTYDNSGNTQKIGTPTGAMKARF